MQVEEELLEDRINAENNKSLAGWGNKSEGD